MEEQRTATQKRHRDHEYFSKTNDDWVPCRIIARRADGSVNIDAKPGTWLTMEEQTTLLRKRAPQKGSASAQGSAQSLGSFPVAQIPAVQLEDMVYRMPVDGLCLWHAAARNDTAATDTRPRDLRGCALDAAVRHLETQMAISLAEDFMKEAGRWREEAPATSDFHVEYIDLPAVC